MMFDPDDGPFQLLLFLIMWFECGFCIGYMLAGGIEVPDWVGGVTFGFVSGIVGWTVLQLIGMGDEP